MFLLFIQLSGLYADEAPVLNSNKDVAKAGFFKLTWQEELGAVEIEEAMNPNFTVPNKLYPGSDSATVISGKPNGEWYYRARLMDEGQVGSWGETTRVTVEHHPLSRALFFFFSGLIMFITTCWLVIRGERLA